MNRWQEIWSKRCAPEGEPLTLSHLIALDGFDGMAAIPAPIWEEYSQWVAWRMGIQPGASLYEVGCGAGAFLFPFYARGHPVGGMDYAANLMELASKVMPMGDFCVGEAINLFPSPQVDFVIAHSVFFYFPDLPYAQRVLQQMRTKARLGMAILDVPDAARQEEALAARRKVVGEALYAERYRDLDHLYFHQEWFAETLAGMDVTVCTEAQQLAGYLHSLYRFNVFITFAERDDLRR